VIDQASFSPRTTTDILAPPAAAHVVLLDHRGRPAGTAEKAGVHHRATPLHLAFSCYVLDRRGRTLITQRSARKPTWPGVWTNSCCGHPRMGETLREAVSRHLSCELGLTPARMALAIGDFTYRAAMDDGTLEHELCPVLVAEVDGELRPDEHEVDDWTWIEWSELTRRVADRPHTLSPWSVAQVRRMVCEGIDPIELLDHSAAGGALDRVHGSSVAGGCRAADVLNASQIRVDLHLSEFLEARRNDVLEAASAIAVLLAEIESLTAAGGKRLRPAFVFSGHRAAGGSDDDQTAVHAAAAVELLHTFALLHDDVMDRSEVRRGRPSAHRSLRRHHRGDAAGAEWFGFSAAVLAGDLAFVWADAMLDRLHGHALEGERIRRARELFTLLRSEVIAGQLLDLQVGCSASADESDAARIALLKSARYTVTRPLQLGAALAGTTSEIERALVSYGDAAGVAFQLRDDVLGMFGDSSVTGKTTSDDLREGKRTLLVVRAMELATAAGRIALSEALGRGQLDDETAERCREVIAESGALASVEAAIDTQLDRAIAALNGLDTDSRESLTDLALFAARRDR
jgi:isopentenyl-diphosphate delta-isomerase type 1